MKVLSGHLTYCTNIHAGETWHEHFSALKSNFPEIKKKVSPQQPMGIGLRLSHLASLDLLHRDKQDEFRSWLDYNQAYVFTMNGFPYGGFHHTRVKDQVHAPDWTTNERLDYTLRLFRILSNLLPEGMEGGISTSPLSYKHWFTTEEEMSHAREQATRNILLVIEELINIHRNEGVLMHLDIEPEPDGLLETGEEFIAWFEEDLLPIGKTTLSAKLSISGSEAERLLKEHLNLCYDVCHFAIGFEPHGEIIDKLSEKGIKVGKIQISAALKGNFMTGSANRADLVNEFSKFNEPTYLHQVVAKCTDGSFIRYPDLSQALEDVEIANVKEWRAHFHVPVFANDFGSLLSTQSDIVKVLEIQKNSPFTKHLEVETYTWEVLPQTLKLPLNQSIVREMEWVKELL